MIVSLPVLCKTVCAVYQRTSRVFFFKFIIFCTDIISGRGCDLSEYVSSIASTQTHSGLFGERAQAQCCSADQIFIFPAFVSLIFLSLTWSEMSFSSRKISAQLTNKCFVLPNFVILRVQESFRQTGRCCHVEEGSAEERTETEEKWQERRALGHCPFLP